MSFLKFWGKKTKTKDDFDFRKDDALADPEAEKRRLRHSLSISRSGRFKQKNRERSGILDRPEFTNQEQDKASQSETSSSASTSSALSTSSASTTTSSRSPKTVYRDTQSVSSNRHKQQATT